MSRVLLVEARMGFSCLVQKIAGKCSYKQLYIEGPSQSDGTCQIVCCWHKFLLVTGLLLLAFVIGSFTLDGRYGEILSIWQSSNEIQKHASFAPGPASSLMEEAVSSPMQKPAPSVMHMLDSKEINGKHKEKCHHGIGALPKGVVQETSDLEMRSLWGNPMEEDKRKPAQNLLAIPVGIKQKENVKKMLQKFHPDNFTVMLFHYDGMIDKWNDLKWSERAIHVAAINQTKWWFAKRFLHPDIVAIYNYIFLWDEDLGVENFNAERYNDLIHGWGVDMKLGYCVQGDRSKNVGVIDSEFVVHQAIPSLGNNAAQLQKPDVLSQPETTLNMTTPGHRKARFDRRVEVRRRAYLEMNIFKQRWDEAVRADECWVDPYGASEDKLNSSQKEGR